MPRNSQTLLYKLAIVKAAGWSIASTGAVLFSFLVDSEHQQSLALTLIGGAVATLLGLWRCSAQGPINDKVIFYYILSDIAFLSAVIHFTGGIINPFTSSLLVPVALGIALLPRYYSLACVVAASTVYMLWLLSSNHHNMMHHNFTLHLYGMGLNFLLSAMLLYIFVTNALGAVKRQEKELTCTREKMINDEQLIGIASLTANTAHALGTPLQILTLITDDIEAGTIEEKDLTIIKQQIATCKQYLQQLAKTAKGVSSTQTTRMTLQALKDELDHHYSLQPHKKSLTSHLNPALLTKSINHNESLLFAIINIVDNALRSCHQQVTISYRYLSSNIYIDIKDDGNGIPDDVVNHIGQPFTTRENGLGLGYYLSNYTIEKHVGELQIANHKDGGALTTIRLPEARRLPEAQGLPKAQKLPKVRQ